MILFKPAKLTLLGGLLLIIGGGLFWLRATPPANAPTNAPGEGQPVSPPSPVSNLINRVIEPIINSLPHPSPVAPREDGLPANVTLAVPFMVQAPFADWGEPYQEACEEASAIMLHYFWIEKSLNATVANDEILKAVEWQKKTLGYYEDTTAAETARMLREHFGHEKVRLVENPTVEQIKKELAAGRPVAVPAAGQHLGNPYFSGAGPAYHMLVIKGYNSKEFITNDPGTRRGESFRYKYSTLMNAIHDWTGSKDTILTGRKVMIVVDPS